MKTINAASDKKKRRGPPGFTLEERENQLISLAVQLAEKQLSEGTAAAQVITHYLKLGSSTERLAKEKLQQENDFLRAKTESLKSAARVEEMFTQALNAMKEYSGQRVSDDEED